MPLSICSTPPPSFSLAGHSARAVSGVANAIRHVGVAALTVLDELAPNRVLRGLRRVLPGALALSAISNVAASPLRHGGGYQTEANYLFDLDAAELRTCLGGTGAGPLPAERYAAQCLTESLLRICAQGTDPGCVDAAARTLNRGMQQAVNSATDNRRAELEVGSNELFRDGQLTARQASQKAKQETRKHFVDSDEYRTAMSVLETALGRQTRRDLTDTTVRYTADEVQLLIGNPLQGEPFWSEAVAPAVQLGRARAEAGEQVYIQRPELVDEQWHAEFLQEVALRYPQAGQAKMTREQAKQVLGDLSFWLNHRDPRRPVS